MRKIILILVALTTTHTFADLDFRGQRMIETDTATPRGQRNAFEIRARYKKIREDLRWNYPRNSDQEWVDAKIREFNRMEQSELNSL